MDEKEIIEKLSKELVYQVEEKIKMIKWNCQFLTDIDNQINMHLETNIIRKERKTFH